MISIVLFYKYNDLITYEELYELNDADKENFIKIRDRAHEMEHSLLHYKEDLIRLVEGDVEWFLTDDDSKDNDNYLIKVVNIVLKKNKNSINIYYRIP